MRLTAFYAFAAAAVWGLLGLVLWNNLIEPDFFGYVNFGREFWTGEGFVRNDPFSYLPTIRPWIFHEWLAGLLFYPFFAGNMDWLLQAGRYAAGFLCAALLLKAAIRRGAGFGFGLLGLACIVPVFSEAFLPILARGFTYLFFAVLVFVCEGLRSGGRPGRAWGLVLLFIVWANVHGGFFFGLIVLALYGAGSVLSGQSPASYLKLLAACTAATFVNPYGWHLWASVLFHAASPDPFIWEWFSWVQSIRFFGPRPLWVLFFLLVLLGFLGSARLLKTDRTGLLILAITAGMAFFHVRHLPLFAFAFCVYMPCIMEAAAKGAWPLKPGVKSAAALAGALMLAGIMLVNLTFYKNELPRAVLGGSPFALKAPDQDDAGRHKYLYPNGVLAFIQKNNLQGNLACDMIWGGYFLWHLYPTVKVAFDSRAESVFPLAVRQEYFSFYWVRPGWGAFLEAWPHEMLAIPANNPLHDAVKSTGIWQEVYEDPLSVLFVKTGEEK
jgi:hypothetical protein